MRLILSAGVVTASLLLLGGPARAGGGSWTFEGQTGQTEPVLVSGNHVHATTGLWLEGVGPREETGAFWGGPQHGPFYGYIAERDASGWGPYPPPLPPDAVFVGEVAFSETEDPRVIDATLDFVMPELDPGYYSLLHCNDPCTRQIGDTMSTPLTVVEDQGQAFITGRVSRMDDGLESLRGRIQNRVGALQSHTSRLESHIESLESKIGSLERGAELATPRSSASGGASQPWGLWIALAAVLPLAAVWTRLSLMRAPGGSRAAGLRSP